MTIQIQLANVDYAHGGNQIFDNLSFALHAGARTAVIGENGTGKSTLFRLMARELHPNAGVVTHQRGLTIGHLHQQSTLNPSTTVREAITSAAGDPNALDTELATLERRLTEPLDDDEMATVLDRYTHVLERLDAATSSNPEAELRAILGGLRFPEHRWDQRIGELSGGERKLVDVGRFLLAQPDVLLLDEPDNHFDVDAKAWLETWLVHHYPGTVCLISHDRYMIDRVANVIFELEDGNVHEYPGNYTAYQRMKRKNLERAAELRELEEREYRKLKASAEQLTQWARQNPKFAGRAENLRRKMEEERNRLESTPKPMVNRRTIDLEFDTERGSTDVIVASDLEKSFGNRTVLRPFDLLVRHGYRVGLVGPNGAGKTTFVRMVLGEEPPTSGTIRLGPSITVGYYAQHQETLDPNITAIDTVRRAKPLTEQQALSFLVGLKFDRMTAMNPVGTLSGGEKARLQIGVLILSGANLLVLDEPTNNLDIPSVEVLEQALLEFPGAVLAISHDRYFLDRICTRIVELHSGEVRDFAGGYSYYAANHDKGSPLTRDLRDAMAAPSRPRNRKKGTKALR